MADYRLYLLDRDGHIVKAIELACADDDCAWAAVKDHDLSVPVELWRGKRRVGLLKPGGEPIDAMNDLARANPLRMGAPPAGRSVETFPAPRVRPG